MDFVWNITGLCNLKCPGCWDPFKAEKNTPFERLAETADGLDVGSAKVVTLTGGEPLLHRDIFRLVRKLKSDGVAEVKICTNGTLLERKAREVVASGITEVHISLDTVDGDAHASLENSDALASSARVLAQIAALKRESVAQGVPVKIVLVPVVDPRAFDRFEQILALAAREGYSVSYQLLCPFDLWTGPVAAEPSGILGFFARMEELHVRHARTLNFYSRIYLAGAKRYVLTKEHAPCGAGEAFQVIDPAGTANACFRRGSDPVNMGCFDERCLIWCRSSKRGESIHNLLGSRAQ